MKHDITLSKEKATTSVLATIYFDYDKFKVKQTTVHEIIKFIDSIPIPKISKLEIIGYTDEQGSEVYNLNLSRLRAEEVANTLANLGFDKTKLIVIGKGKSEQISKDPAKNRRVEIKQIQ